MDQQEAAPVRRRRMGAHGMMLRRKRIFARPREGLSYEEMATLRGRGRTSGGGKKSTESVVNA